MTRENLDRQIRNLLNDVLSLGKMVEEVTLESVTALAKRDVEAAKELYNRDSLINRKRFEIENAAIGTLATQQPVAAGDLRLMASILDITTEIERMGDYAKGIAKICVILKDEPLIMPLIDIPRMAEIAVDMLRRALDAFIAGDVETARAIPEEDDEVDRLYNQVYRDLAILIHQDPNNIDQVNLLLWAAHNLERLADRVTNICERTIYSYTGVLTEIKSSDDEIQGLYR